MKRSKPDKLLICSCTVEFRIFTSIEFPGIWEHLNNPTFNRVEFEAIKNEAGSNAFVMTPTRWGVLTNAIGIMSKAIRYGGTYAHKNIAFEFASWISAEKSAEIN